MPAPVPAPVAQVLQRGPATRVFLPIDWSVQRSQRGCTPIYMLDSDEAQGDQLQ